MFLNFAEAKDLRSFATAERRIFVVLSRYSEACWINSAIPDFVSALCYRQISALFIDAWTSEQDFMAALGNLPGIGKQVILGGSESSELNQLAGRLLPANSLGPSHSNLRKLCIGASADSPRLDISLVGSCGLGGLKSLTLHGSSIEGSFEVFVGLLALQELDISLTSVDCSRALELISSAPWAPQIKKLGLSRTNVQGNIAALGNCTNLEKADFYKCFCITGDISVLGRCPNLTAVNFSGTRFSPMQITGDIAVLGNCTNLVTANFWFTGITGDIKALGNCTNLVKARFYDCKNITGDKEAIKRALPSCSFYFHQP